MAHLAAAGVCAALGRGPQSFLRIVVTGGGWLHACRCLSLSSEGGFEEDIVLTVTIFVCIYSIYGSDFRGVDLSRSERSQ